jgi:hypothetical protein
MGPSVRRDDGRGTGRMILIPSFQRTLESIAGECRNFQGKSRWVPAFAGTTVVCRSDDPDPVIPAKAGIHRP